MTLSRVVGSDIVKSGHDGSDIVESGHDGSDFVESGHDGSDIVKSGYDGSDFVESGHDGVTLSRVLVTGRLSVTRREHTGLGEYPGTFM